MSALNDDPSVHPLLAALRAEVDGWTDPPARVLVGEIVLPTAAQSASYYGTPDRPELHLAFNFHPLRTPWDAGRWRTAGRPKWSACSPGRTPGPPGSCPTTISLVTAPATGRRPGPGPRPCCCSTLRGTPFLYAGEELGLEDAVVPPARQVDPGGRDGCRAPMPWNPFPSHGWAGGPDAWLPWPPGAAGSRNVAAQRDDPGSMAQLYRRLLALRRGSDALRSGDFSWVETPEGVLAYTRHSAGGDRRLVAVNFGSDPAGVELPAGPWVVDVSSVGPGGEAASGRVGLAGDEAVVLRPV